MVKPCPACQAELPADEFYPDPTKATGLSSWCRTCTRRRAAERHVANRDEDNQRQRAYYRRNRDRWRGYAKLIRTEALDAYGGRCVCCGEDTPEFLSIDHVNNDGESHRREMEGYGRAIYRWLKKHGYPQDGRFQVLCHNCNMAKGLYGGCPHQGPVPGRRQQTSQFAG